MAGRWPGQAASAGPDRVSRQPGQTSQPVGQDQARHRWAADRSGRMGQGGMMRRQAEAAAGGEPGAADCGGDAVSRVRSAEPQVDRPPEVQSRVATASGGQGPPQAKVRQIGTKTFYFKNGRWVDSSVKPDEDAKAEKVVQFSDAYFRLARVAEGRIQPVLQPGRAGHGEARREGLSHRPRTRGCDAVTML